MRPDKDISLGPVEGMLSPRTPQQTPGTNLEGSMRIVKRGISGDISMPIHSMHGGVLLTKAAPPLLRSPNPQDIAQRAYELFLARGGIHGRDREDWAQAERELAARPRPG